MTEDDTGIKVLYEPNNPLIEYDVYTSMSDFSLCFDSVVAIHGLGAHPDDTWCNNVGSKEELEWVNWLEAPFMLPNDIPNARIMRYGYMSQWFGKNAIKQSTSEVAKDFLINLRRWRKVHQHIDLLIYSH